MSLTARCLFFPNVQVPRVFIKGKFIGGGQETAALDRQGALEKMLKEAGAI